MFGLDGYSIKKNATIKFSNLAQLNYENWEIEFWGLYKRLWPYIHTNSVTLSLWTEVILMPLLIIDGRPCKMVMS